MVLCIYTPWADNLYKRVFIYIFMDPQYVLYVYNNIFCSWPLKFNIVFQVFFKILFFKKVDGSGANGDRTTDTVYTREN